MTRDQFERLHRELGKLLYSAELIEPDNPEGTYPPEWLLTLRLAWVSAGRAVKDASREPIA
jgi:hypothetical protein